MAHAKKYNRGTMVNGRMFLHFERKKVEVIHKDGTVTMEYVKFGNEKIDPTRSHLNYNLAPHREGGQGAFIRQRCSEVHCLKRNDVNVMCSWVVTKPENITKSETKRFFEETYKFLSNRYGTANVISAYVHMDETNPHMHFAFVPVAHDIKKNRDTVAANKVINRSELQKFHPALTKHMIKAFGRDVGIETGEVAGRGEVGNLTIKQLKGLTVEITAIRDENKCLQDENAQLRANQEQQAEEYRWLNLLQQALIILTSDIEALKTQVRVLTKEEKNNLKPKGTMKRSLKMKIDKDGKKQISTLGGEIADYRVIPEDSYQGFLSKHQQLLDVLLPLLEENSQLKKKNDICQNPKIDWNAIQLVVDEREEQRKAERGTDEPPKDKLNKQFNNDEWER